MKHFVFALFVGLFANTAMGAEYFEVKAADARQQRALCAAVMGYLDEGGTLADCHGAVRTMSLVGADGRLPLPRQYDVAIEGMVRFRHNSLHVVKGYLLTNGQVKIEQLVTLDTF